MVYAQGVNNKKELIKALFLFPKPNIEMYDFEFKLVAKLSLLPSLLPFLPHHFLLFFLLPYIFFLLINIFFKIYLLHLHLPLPLLFLHPYYLYVSIKFCKVAANNSKN